MKQINDTLNCKIITRFTIMLILSMLFLPLFVSANFQMEWDSQIIAPETWTQINLNNIYSNTIVVAGPEYSSTTNANGIGVWITNVTSSSFMIRTSDENLASVDSISIHYIAIEEGNWTLPNSNIKIEAGKLSTYKVGSSSTGWTCPTNGDLITFSNTFNSNPLVISTRGTNTNPSSWAVTFQNSPVSNLQPVTTTQMCIGLSQSKAITPGAIVNPEIIYWLAADEGNGTIGGIEYEILWNLQDTGDSGANWINGYGDSPPHTQSWGHTWISSPNIIIPGATSVAGVDGGWPVIYDTGNTADIRMFIDEANERSHTGSESGGGWAFSGSGEFGSFPPNNLFVNFSKSQISLGQNNSINASIIDRNGNNTISNVIATLQSPNTTLYNVSLNQIIENQSLITNDLELGEKNYTSISSGEVLGEAGLITLANRTSKLIKFTQKYNQTPIIIAITASQNNDDSPFIPIIHNINTTHANISLCRDNGATTCDNNYLQEDVHYVIFDINKSNKYEWLEVGRVNAITNGVNTAFSFNKTFSNAPYIWALPQSYNIGSSVANGIAAHSWFTSITTTNANIVGCDHPGTADTCAGTATENYGYLAIDMANANFSKFAGGSQTISASTWTGISYGETYNKPRILTMVNSENGAQDGKYPWAKNLITTGAQIRYCEADGPNYCDTHNGEVTNWIVFEEGTIAIGNGGDDIEKNTTIETYANLFNEVTHNITLINIQINVTDYVNNGSIGRGNTNPDIEIFLPDSGGWKSAGFLNVTDIGLYQINITDEDLLDLYEKNYNRNLKIEAKFMDYYSTTQIDKIEINYVNVIVDYKKYTDKFNKIFNQTQICGTYNLTRLYSFDYSGALNMTAYNNISFNIACGPHVELLSPKNYTKLLTDNGIIKLNFSIDSLDVNLTCNLYINSIFNSTHNCTSLTNNTINITFPSGLFNWTLNVTDTNNFTAKPVPESFYNILNYKSKIKKSISSFSSNMYLIDINLTNKINTSTIINPIDYVKFNYNYGSFNYPFDWENSTNGYYKGSILGWNFSLLSLNSININYSIINITKKAFILDMYVIGLD